MLARPKAFIAGALMLSLLAPAGPALGEDARAMRPRVLYVSSEGAESSSVAMFTVDRQTGALNPLANPVPAGPGRLAWSPRPTAGSCTSRTPMQTGC